MYLIVPSPPKEVDGVVAWYNTYDNKKTTDKTKAVHINRLCKTIFLFLIATNAAINIKKVVPLIMAFNKGKKEKSVVSVFGST